MRGECAIVVNTLALSSSFSLTALMSLNGNKPVVLDLRKESNTQVSVIWLLFILVVWFLLLHFVSSDRSFSLEKRLVFLGFCSNTWSWHNLGLYFWFACFQEHSTDLIAKVFSQIQPSQAFLEIFERKSVICQEHRILKKNYCRYCGSIKIFVCLFLDQLVFWVV